MQLSHLPGCEHGREELVCLSPRFWNSAWRRVRAEEVYERWLSKGPDIYLQDRGVQIQCFTSGKRRRLDFWVIFFFLSFPVCCSLFPNLGSRRTNVNQRSIRLLRQRQPDQGLHHGMAGEHLLADGRDRSQLGKGWGNMSGSVHLAPHSSQAPLCLRTEAAAGLCAHLTQWVSGTRLPRQRHTCILRLRTCRLFIPLECQQAAGNQSPFTCSKPIAAPFHPGLPGGPAQRYQQARSRDKAPRLAPLMVLF